MLPFETIIEAEVSLGRNLTFAERLWFDYSARKSDFVLYCHNIVIGLILYILFPLPYMFIELMRSNSLKTFKIQPKVNRSFSDMFNCYKKVTKTIVLIIGPSQILSYPVIEWVGIRSGLPLPSGSEILLQIWIYFVIEDYANYWLHRLLHSKWGYEKIHRIHHEYTAPIGFSAAYAHWAEILILGSATFMGPLIVPCHMFTFWLWLIFRQMEAVEIHSGYDIPFTPTKYIPFYGGAIYHDYHHYVGAKTHSNFASVFTYCDYIYGTNKGYRYYKEITEKKNKIIEKNKRGQYRQLLHLNQDLNLS